MEMKIIEAEISRQCIVAHAGSVEDTVDAALRAIKLDVMRSTTALGNKQFPKGGTIRIRAVVDRPSA